MTISELVWFAGQINAEKWRIFYARMASMKRLALYEVDPPPITLPMMARFSGSLRRFRDRIEEFYDLPDDDQAFAERFAALSRAWKIGRGPTSSAVRMSQHPAYQQIIALGQRAVPLILQDLAGDVDHWFIALHAITGETPVDPRDAGNLSAMAKAWVSWGASRGLLPDHA